MTEIKSIRAVKAGSMLDTLVKRALLHLNPELDLPENYAPSTDGNHALRVIEEFRIDSKSKPGGHAWVSVLNTKMWDGAYWRANRHSFSMPNSYRKSRKDQYLFVTEGETFLESAMRCFVAAILGDQVPVSIGKPIQGGTHGLQR